MIRMPPILLRKALPEDFDAYARLVGDIRVMAQITERAIPLDEARGFFDGILEVNARQPGLGHFSVIDPATGTIIGIAKLQQKGTEAELGYMLLPERWGQGIGGKIADELIAEAHGHPHLQGLFAIIDPSNAPSRRILTQRGFTSREVREMDGLPGEVLGMALRRP